jgi:hypothetical protein
MGIQMGEMSKLGWLIGLTEQALWAASLYLLYLLWPVTGISLTFYKFSIESGSFIEGLHMPIGFRYFTEAVKRMYRAGLLEWL